MLLWIAGILFLLSAAVGAWTFRHSSFRAVQRRRLAVNRNDVAAVEALLADAEVDPGRVLVVFTDPEKPAWNHRWGWLDFHLRVYKRFGAYYSGLNVVGLDGGRVVSLSLVDTQLSNLVPLIDLPMLHTLRLRDNRIETLAGIPPNCRWTHLDLSNNDLTSLDAVEDCTDLRELHLERTQLSALPSLHTLVHLEKLNGRYNMLQDASGLTGHPSLKDVDLYGNRLTSAVAFDGLPWLERLNLGGNALTTLEGLGHLPALKNLDVVSNRLSHLDEQWWSGCPALQHVSAARNPIQALPPGFVHRNDAATYEVQIQPEGKPWPCIEVRDTPIAEQLQQQTYAAHDGTQVHRVSVLPRAHGRWQKAWSSGATRTGLSSGVHEQGHADWLQGVQARTFAVDEAVTVTITASVEHGRLRVYLRDGTHYQYTEAIPGKPLRISGSLITGTDRYVAYFEAVGGRAERLVWSIES